MIRPTTKSDCCHSEESDLDPAALKQLTHPRFFAGQLLTDRDLRDLLAYVQDRFALLRYRDGWGIVCGMIVKPSANQTKPLTITAGYSVDCAGRDLILECDEEICLPPPKREMLPCPPIEPLEGEEAENVDFPGPGTIPKDRLGVFDIVACFAVEDYEPAIVLADCKRECEDSRRREIVKIKPICKAPDSLPTSESADCVLRTKEILALLKGLKDRLTHNDHKHFYQTDLAGAISPPVSEAAETIRKWIAWQRENHPRWLEIYPGLQRWWEEAQKPKPYNTPWKVAAFLSWMIDALRHPDGDCADSCPDPNCVPLARVWAEWSESRWQLRYIDQAPPWRKMFDPCCPGNPLCVSHYLRQPWREVRGKLAFYGIETYVEWEEPHKDPANLEDKFQAESDLKLLTPGEAVVAVVTPWTKDDPLDSRTGRVIRFRKFQNAEKNLFEGPDKLRMPIVKPGAGFKVTFHDPKGDLSFTTPVFQIPAGDEIDAGELRPDSKVDVAIRLNEHFDARQLNADGEEVRSWYAFVYDEFDFEPDDDPDNQSVRRIRQVRKMEAFPPETTICWRVHVSPKLLGKHVLEFALLLKETSDVEPRYAAVWEHVEVTVGEPLRIPVAGGEVVDPDEGGGT